MVGVKRFLAKPWAFRVGEAPERLIDALRGLLYRRCCHVRTCFILLPSAWKEEESDSGGADGTEGVVSKARSVCEDVV